MAATVATGVTAIGARCARRWNLVDQPSRRKHHQRPVALLGGASVLITMALTAGGAAALLPVDAIGSNSLEARFLTASALGALLLAAVGLWDDIRPIRVSLKLVAQAIAALMLVGLAWPTGPEALIAGTISFGWLILMTNAFNLIDNMDGAAAGIGAVAAGFLSLLAAGDGARLMGAILAGALIGFLVHNHHPARVFLGDGGSLPIGFLLGGLGLWLARGHPAEAPAALLIMAVPLTDTCLVILSRLRRGMNPLTTPGTDHMSHRLVALGLSIPAAARLLWVVGIGFGVSAWATTRMTWPTTVVISAGACLISLGVILYLEHRAPVGLTRVEHHGCQGRAGEPS